MKAVGLELTENDENREPVRGPDAARIWSRVLPAAAGQEPWVLDFFSHLDRVRDFCDRHGIAYREASARSLVIPAPEPEALESLIDRFQAETFGARAGGSAASGDRRTRRRTGAARRGRVRQSIPQVLLLRGLRI